MSTASEGPRSVQEVLKLYASGRRDFSCVSIGPEEAGFEDERLDGADFSRSFLDVSFEGAGLDEGETKAQILLQIRSK